MKLKQLLPIIGIIILIYVLTTLDIEKIVTVFATINPGYALLAFGSIIPIVLFANYQWQLILKRHNIHVSFWYTLKNMFIGYFYGFITPGGLGGYTRALYLSDKTGEPVQKCFVNILILNTIDYIALLSLGVVGAVVLSSRFPSFLPIVLVLFLIMVTLFVVFLRKETGKKLFQKLVQSKLFNPFREKWSTHIKALYEDLPTFRDLAFPYAISLTGWIVWFSELYLLSKLFSIEVPYFYFILIIAVANVIASLPITIYGLGTREVALIALFSMFTVARENVVSLSLFWYILIWVFPSIIGAAVTLVESRQTKPSRKKPTST